MKQNLLRLAKIGILSAVMAAPLCAVAEEAKPAPTLEQRVGALEAYVTNSDPSSALEVDGKVPEGLTTPIIGSPGPGHNAWLMTSAALVLFMTLPGLALFYGGLVRRKNVLSILAQCLGITALSTLIWWAVGYSLVFSEGGGAFYGGFEHLFFKGVNSDAIPGIWVSQNVFAMFQLMFAIITPALIIGAVAERMRFKAILGFSALWLLAVYIPLAHMTWGSGGFMNGLGNPEAGIKAIDFAGGTVVHMSSGWSALILCIILGKRLGFGKEKLMPHNLVLCMVGTGMLWVGWYGFNAGSALAADGIAANAFTTTTLATAIAAGTWGLIEYLHRGKASVLGFCSGVVAGLVVITPAAGFVTSTGAVIMGVIGAIIPYIFVMKLKEVFGYDDSLDTFGIHGVGGTVGALLTGIFASAEANPLVADVKQGLFLEQFKSVILTVILSVVATTVIALIVKAVIGLRPTPEEESTGLDLVDHGEEGYNL